MRLGPTAGCDRGHKTGVSRRDSGEARRDLYRVVAAVRNCERHFAAMAARGTS